MTDLSPLNRDITALWVFTTIQALLILILYAELYLRTHAGTP